MWRSTTATLKTIFTVNVYFIASSTIFHFISLPQTEVTGSIRNLRLKGDAYFFLIKQIEHCL